MAVMRRMNPSDLLKGKQKFSKQASARAVNNPPVAKAGQVPTNVPPMAKKAASRKKALQKFAGSYK